MYKDNNSKKKFVKSGIIGWPLNHSFSPNIHNYWFDQFSLNYKYQKFPIEPENIKEYLLNIRKSDLVGINVTVPYKELVIPMVDYLEDSAKKIGAVNIITINNDGRLIGSNSDSFGFIENLNHYYPKLDLKDKFCTVLGSGGAARAVIHSLQEVGVKKIFIMSRNIDKAKYLVKEFGFPCEVINWDDKKTAYKDISLLVNATPMGMPDIPLEDIKLNYLPSSTIVYDLVYSNNYTPLIKEAISYNYRALDGLGMLLYQAIPAFNKWFEKKPTVTEDLRKFVLRK